MSRSNPRFGRVVTALITPFTHDGKVNYDCYEQLVHRQFKAGVNSVLSVGTTGESPTLTTEEKLKLFEIVKYISTGYPGTCAIANVGSYNTAASVDLAREAEIIGMDGIMAVVPYYNKPPQEGLYQHFSAIADATELPIIMYNIPGRVVINLLPETIIRLAANHDNIVALKEAHSDLEADKMIIEGTSDEFEILSGNDDTTLDLMEIGGSGVISTISNVAPKRMCDMVNTFAQGDKESARKKEQELLPLMEGLFEESNPILTKEALHILDIDVGGLRLPLISATKEQSEKLRKTMEQCAPIE